MARCSSCQAEIEWGISQHGHRLPVDKLPDEQRGNLMRFTDEEGRVRFFHATNQQDVPFEQRGPERYVSHFATCPFAGKHRKRTRDNRG